MQPRQMWKIFLKTNAGKQIIILEDQGYRLCGTQMELTIIQELFLYHGKVWLNKEKEKEFNKKSKA